MVNNKDYSSGIKAKPLFFIETKRVASLIYQGFIEHEIKEKAVRENLFQVATESRKKEIASTILKRLKTLDDLLLQKLVESDTETGKIITLYTILKTDRLFFEFMNEVYKDKFIVKESELTDSDFSLFFESRRQQSEKVASWKDYTFYKLQQVITRILIEAGLIKKTQKSLEIVSPLLNIDVKKHLQEIGDGLYVKILVGE